MQVKNWTSITKFGNNYKLRYLDYTDIHTCVPNHWFSYKFEEDENKDLDRMDFGKGKHTTLLFHQKRLWKVLVYELLLTEFDLSSTFV